MDNEKREALLKLGYFPVTDEFWAQKKMHRFIGKGFSWAFKLPDGGQPYMPYHESYLAEHTIEDATHWANVTLKHVY